MRGLIKKILQTESEMIEMGMKIGKLKVIQPQNYLVKSLKSKEKSQKVKEKDLVLKLNNLYQEIFEDLKNLNWYELRFELQNGHYYLILPSRIKTKIKKLSYLFDKVNGGPYNHLIEPRLKIEQMVIDYENEIRDELINMYTEDDRNRTHFPQGLPKSLLGFNLGFKMYRKLVNDLRFIQSAENASQDVQNIFRQLIEQPDLNCVISKTSVLVLRRNLSKEEKIKIVSEYIYELYHNFVFHKAMTVGRDLVLDGPLLRELNENKVQKLSKELYDYSKKSSRTPFKDSPYDFSIPDDDEEN